MIGRRPALFLLAFALMAVPAMAKTDWAKTVTATPEGGILMGNPAARIRIIEFASYTCGHCKAFHEVGIPALKAKYLPAGNVAIEHRSFVRNGEDLSASLLASCLPARPALGFVDKLFAEQEKWTQPFVEMSVADTQAIAAVPPEQQPAKKAELGGLDRWADTRGVPIAKGAICLRDKATQGRLLANRNEAITRYKLEGTPLFVINGVSVAGAIDWATLEPALQAAIAAPAKPKAKSLAGL